MRRQERLQKLIVLLVIGRKWIKSKATSISGSSTSPTSQTESRPVVDWTYPCLQEQTSGQEEEQGHQERVEERALLGEEKAETLGGANPGLQASLR